jgi:hypothetical protein
MRSLSASRALQLPVRLHDITLGRPVDLLVSTDTWHVLGFVVHCGDDSTRFLPYGASQVSEDEIAVASALMLLEDVDFYVSRGTSFRSLLGGIVARDRRTAGSLRDALLGAGHVEELVVELASETRTIPAAGSHIVPEQRAA